MNSKATIKITRLSEIIYPSRDVVILALDEVYHLIGQFILADYYDELGNINTILVIGRLNGKGRDHYSVISTAGDFVVNKVDDLADVAEVPHGVNTEIHIAYIKDHPEIGPEDWYIVTLGPDGITRDIEPITRSRIFKNLDDNYRWFYVKGEEGEPGSLKREDDFLSTHQSEIQNQTTNKPTMTVSYNNTQLGNKYYIPNPDTTIQDPIFNVTVKDYNGVDITEECEIEINDTIITPESSSDIHDFKLIGTFNSDCSFTIKSTCLELNDIELTKTTYFYFPIKTYYGTCRLENSEIVVNENEMRTKLIYTDLSNIDVTYTLDRNRSILIVPTNIERFLHIFDDNSLDYINDYTFEQEFEYNNGTYLAYYKNSNVKISNFRQIFTWTYIK